jgi:hypothetical protein
LYDRELVSQEVEGFDLRYSLHGCTISLWFVNRKKMEVGIVNFQKKKLMLYFSSILDKFYNRADVPWVQLIWRSYYTNSVPHSNRPCGSFWWRDIMQLSDKYTEISSIQPGS